jgi:hypothetical protein
MLAAIVIVVTMVKLLIAARTFGTDDVQRWTMFAAGVAEEGPVGIYRLHMGALYDHPPLIGYLLRAVNGGTNLGLGFPLAMRLPAITADTITPFIMLELARARSPLRLSFVAAASVASSPILIIVSGFHGNTDPIFVMFTLLAVYLLVDRRAPSLAGCMIAIAVGIKLMPVVVVPVMLAFAWRTGWRYAMRFVLPASLFLAITWGPVVLDAWTPFADHVLGYAGGRQPWGLIQLGSWTGVPTGWLAGVGRFLVLASAAGLPAFLTWKRPGYAVEASAVALIGFLVLSPGFATQYIAWFVAPAYLVSLGWATAANMLASGLLLEVYTRWNGGVPWNVARSSWFTAGEAAAAFAIWLVLLVIVVVGLRHSSEQSSSEASTDRALGVLLRD